MAKITVVINTLNEELNIAYAITSVKKLADEIIVVDMKSDDDTVKIAREHGAKIFLHRKSGYVEPARNFAIAKASGDWILVLDADERIMPSLSKKLRLIANSNESSDYYAIPRKNKIFGKWMKHSRWWPDYNIRFFKKGHVNWTNRIHGAPETLGTGADIPAKEKYAIVHEHYSSIDQYVIRMNRYTSIQSKNKLDDGYRFIWQDLITKPSGEFFSRYFFGNGYKDGLHGLAVASLQAFSEMVLYLKLWQSDNYRQQDLEISDVIKLQKRTVRDLYYWQADTLGGIINKIKRRFKLP